MLGVSECVTLHFGALGVISPDVKMRLASSNSHITIFLDNDPERKQTLAFLPHFSDTHIQKFSEPKNHKNHNVL